MTQDITEDQERQDMEVQARAEHLAASLQEAFAMLIERRDIAYEEAIAPLDAEQEAIQKEHGAIEESARNLEAFLPARARVSQYEADCLTLEGKREEAALKLEEMKAAEDAPRLMRERQQEISARIEAIEAEKRGIARRIFETWHSKCQQVIRAVEHGLFVTLLDGLEQSFYEFQDRTHTGRGLDPRERGLFHQGHLIGLTADERSVEWRSGSRWYGGR